MMSPAHRPLARPDMSMPALFGSTQIDILTTTTSVHDGYSASPQAQLRNP